MSELSVLEPCPGCGRIDRFTVTRDFTRRMWQWSAECGRCNWRGPYEVSQDEAIAAWNQRVTPLPTARDVESE